MPKSVMKNITKKLSKLDKTNVAIIVVLLALIVVVAMILKKKCKKEGFVDLLSLDNANFVKTYKLTEDDKLEIANKVADKLDNMKDRMGNPKYTNPMNYLDVLPIGTILMWNQAYIPLGWSRCDGFNGTPDLRKNIPTGAGGNYHGIGSRQVVSVGDEVEDESANNFVLTYVNFIMKVDVFDKCIGTRDDGKITGETVATKNIHMPEKKEKQNGQFFHSQDGNGKNVEWFQPPFNVEDPDGENYYKPMRHGTFEYRWNNEGGGSLKHEFGMRSTVCENDLTTLGDTCCKNITERLNAKNAMKAVDGQCEATPAGYTKGTC